MIALWIALGVLALIGAVLFLDVSVCFRYDETWGLKARVLGIPIDVKKLLKKEKKEKKKPKKQVKKEEKTEEKPQEKRTLEDFFSFLKAIGGAVKGAYSSLKKHLKIKLLRFELTVSSEDAAQTALNYGRANAAFYGFISVLSEYSRFSMNEKKVQIVPDYESGHFACKTRIRLRIKPIFLITAFLAGWRGFMRVTP